jgi:hypothetical protein
MKKKQKNNDYHKKFLIFGQNLLTKPNVMEKEIATAKKQKNTKSETKICWTCWNQHHFDNTIVTLAKKKKVLLGLKINHSHVIHFVVELKVI